MFILGSNFGTKAQTLRQKGDVFCLHMMDVAEERAQSQSRSTLRDLEKILGDTGEEVQYLRIAIVI